MVAEDFNSDEQSDIIEPGSDRHWWLTAGPEYCFACEASSHAEGLAYCVACDQATCTLCSTDSTELGGILCPECAADTHKDEP